MSSENARWWREQAKLEGDRDERTLREGLKQLRELILDAETRRKARVIHIDGPLFREWLIIVKHAQHSPRFHARNEPCPQCRREGFNRTAKRRRKFCSDVCRVKFHSKRRGSHESSSKQGRAGSSQVPNRRAAPEGP